MPPSTPTPLAVLVDPQQVEQAGQALPPARVPVLSEAEQQAIRDNVEASDSPNTRRTYESAWDQWCRWCRDHDIDPIPATPEALAGYLSTATRQDGLSYTVGTLRLHLAAIGRAHRERGLTAPIDHPLVYRTWRGLRRRRGTKQVGAAPLTADLLARACSYLGGSVLDTRDRALLHVGFAAATRRSELTALRLQDVALHPQGIRLWVVRIKTGGQGQWIDLARGTPAAEALLDWLDVLAASGAPAEPTTPLLRPIRGTRIGAGRLCDAGVRLAVRRAGRLAGLDLTGLSAHSLRSGWATTAAEAGLSAMEIRDGGGWSSVVTVDRYVRHRRQWGASSAGSRVQTVLAAELASEAGASA